MPLTFVGSATNWQDGSVTSLVVTRTVTAGNLLALFVKHEGAATTVTAQDSGAVAAVGASYQSHSNGDLHGRWLYWLATPGATSVTVNLAASRAFVRAHLWEFSYSGTATFDTEANAQGSSTAIASGAMTTAGTDEVVFGSYGEYSGDIITSPLINGVAAAGSIINTPVGSLSATWYRILTSTFTGGTASATKAGTAAWIGNGIAFKAAASVSAALGGTGASGMTEADIVAGGKTITLTLTGAQWIP